MNNQQPPQNQQQQQPPPQYPPQQPQQQYQQQPPPQYQPPPPPPPGFQFGPLPPLPPAKNMALIGMILGIASLLFPMFSGICVCVNTTRGNIWTSAVSFVSSGTYAGAAVISVIGLLVAAGGLLLSVMAMRNLKSSGQPAAIAIAGLVCSIVGAVFCFSCSACYGCLCAGVGTVSYW